VERVCEGFGITIAVRANRLAGRRKIPPMGPPTSLIWVRSWERIARMRALGSQLFLRPLAELVAGIGRRLLDELLAGRRQRWATLTVVPAADARAIYDRWGWRQVGSTRPGKMPGMAVMLLEFPGSAELSPVLPKLSPAASRTPQPGEENSPASCTQQSLHIES
jgi:hypothetical protein